MKLRFDSNQRYQLDAVSAVVDLFAGNSVTRVVDTWRTSVGLFKTWPNTLWLSPEEIFSNRDKIQSRNSIPESFRVPELDFGIEMETGTGKTYCYIRTVLELASRYGWTKFVIVVPSVAIREGVVKTFQVTREHFRELYPNLPYTWFEYDGGAVSEVRHFATSSTPKVMIITAAAFNKEATVMNQSRDQMNGAKPIDVLASVRPVIILDEPQTVEGAKEDGKTRAALRRLNAIATFRYSATHRDPKNLLYRLTPAVAYRECLVKRVEALSVVDEGSLSVPSLALERVEQPGRGAGDLRAKVKAYAQTPKGLPAEKLISLKRGDDLAEKTKNSRYAGFVVSELDSSSQVISFSNGQRLTLSAPIGGSRQAVLEEQVRSAVRVHLARRAALRPHGVKPLCLFFLDKVASYHEENGWARRVFLEEMAAQSANFGATDLDLGGCHAGYFAVSGKGKSQKIVERESAVSENAAAYELIMKGRERLLSFDEPVEFIFTHSALREGWDNPNVCVVCTLREGTSEIRRRQEIGRGMRLVVNQEGERLRGELPGGVDPNRVTVVVSEGFKDFVDGLQAEYLKDGDEEAALPKIENHRKKKIISPRADVLASSDWKALWGAISQKSRYWVNFGEEQIVSALGEAFSRIRVSRPKVATETRLIDFNEGTSAVVDGGILSQRDGRTRLASGVKIDVVGEIAGASGLTRRTVARALEGADLKSVLNDPGRFVAVASVAATEIVRKFSLENVEYEASPAYFSDEALKSPREGYGDRVTLTPNANSVADGVFWDSAGEGRFASALNGDARVKVFAKLPSSFRVRTPLGEYNPDWAILARRSDGGDAVYFVVETKFVDDEGELRPAERGKIESAQKHFQVVGVRYLTSTTDWSDFVRSHRELGLIEVSED
jgi:type III restriction enzyme